MTRLIGERELAWKPGPRAADKSKVGDPFELCQVCGATHAGDCNCAAEEASREASGLRLLPPSDSRTDSAAAPEVRLIREFKGPTVEDLLEDDGEHNKSLPAQVRDVLHAIESGDYRRASSSLDDSIGGLLRGPGFCRRGQDRLFTAALLIAFAVLCLLTIFAWIWA